MGYNAADIYFFHQQARNAIRMARAYPKQSHTRIIWQERAADYRECVIDYMRKRQGWTLAQRKAGRR